MAPSTRKLHRRRPGVLTIEQTGDPRLLTPILEAAAVSFAPPPAFDCVLLAMLGEVPIGALALAIELERASIPLFWVLDPHRRQGVGAALLRAARLAARTRGVTTLHLVAPLDAAAFLRKLGFDREESPAPLDAARTAAAQLARWRLDISRDGIILR